jgi:thioredoxin reductase (NADPH)
VDCNANFFKGEDGAVIGEASAAADGALSLLAVARRVHLISEKL